jgi:hypothetical protein
MAPFRIGVALARPDAISAPDAEKPVAIPLRAGDGESGGGQARVDRAIPSERIVDDSHAFEAAPPLSDQQRPWLQD